MSGDPWRSQLRLAGSDPSAIESVLAAGVPVDGLQHAGQAVIRCSGSAAFASIITTLLEALSQRVWSGDPELIVEAVDQSPASVSYVDLVTGTLWPDEVFDIDQGPEDFDADDSVKWLPTVGAGSKPAYAVMARFIATFDSPDLASRLRTEISGSGAFRRFQAELSQHDDQYTSWHRFSDDARLGRARTLRPRETIAPDRLIRG